ncbi:uncharacterized protein LOC128548991 isoform X2 [Mercenaria mercenaria]|nr:uncharacterized protein LOC128548991 isoform X2 [Mercenaria mercenaria]
MVLVTLLLACSCFWTCEGNRNKKVLTVLTYNLWLHEYNEKAYRTKEERKKNIIHVLKKSEADTVCLQEVYFGKDIEDFVDSLKDKYPYTFSGIHITVNGFPPQAKGKRKPPCDNTRLVTYLNCIKTNGCTATADDRELLACVLSNCVNQLQNIFQKDSQECLTCMTMSTANIMECTSTRPVVGGRTMNVGGLFLLSNRKLRDVSYTDYHPTTKELFPTGFIKAKVDDIATIVCTHLSAVGTNDFYEPELMKKGFTSYSDMNAYETRTLIRSLRGIQPAIILGDFNTGFAYKPQLRSVIPDSYVEMLKRFTTRPALKFTYRDPSNRKIQSVIDHIFVKNLHT